jgi:hypothetical protein
MRLKIFILLILLIFLQSVCRSQESFNRIFNSSKEKISEIENLGYKVIHLDLDILVSGEEEQTRIFLNTGYKYTIIACNDQNRVKTLQIDLNEEIDNKRIHLLKGRDGASPPGSSVIIFKPEKDENFLITIKAIEFLGSATNGRYYLIVASKPSPLELTTNKKADARYNSKTGKLNLENLTAYQSTFRIDKINNKIEHENDSFTIKYQILSSYISETDPEAIKYLVKDQNGKEYTIEYNSTNKSLLIMDLIGRNNLYSGTRYILN